MMDYDALVKRARNAQLYTTLHGELCDAIEALVKERDEALKRYGECVDEKTEERRNYVIAANERDVALARAEKAEAKAVGYLAQHENCKRHYTSVFEEKKKEMDLLREDLTHMEGLAEQYLAAQNAAVKERDEWKATADHLLDIEREWIDANESLAAGVKLVEAERDALRALLAEAGKN